MPCPICKKQCAPQYRPFCSRRCADIDLGRWLTGKYAVASEREESAEEVADLLDGEPPLRH